MSKEIIELKGTGDGVKIYLPPNEKFSEILLALQDKLRAWRKFFGSGHCNMYFIGRKLTKSDTLRLEAVVSALLPECTIVYGQKKVGDTTELPQELIEALHKTDSGEDGKKEPEDVVSTRQFKAIRNIVPANFKSNRARLYEGDVKTGDLLESDEHLILVGNVADGGEIAAYGNVIVIGTVRGSVEAGCMGNKNAYILATDLQSARLKIAGTNKVFWNEDKIEGFKKAQLINNEIYIEDFC